MSPQQTRTKPVGVIVRHHAGNVTPTVKPFPTSFATAYLTWSTSVLVTTKLLIVWPTQFVLATFVSINKFLTPQINSVLTFIVITDGNEVTIIDVTCPFESNADTLTEAEVSKTQKYEHLKNHFEAQGKIWSVFGFVIGALGTPIMNLF